MSLHKIITTVEFKRMMGYQTAAENHAEQQYQKENLLTRIREAYGDKFGRLKDGTRKAIDMMCWFASERGFTFAGDDYLADRYEVSDRTIRNVARELRSMNLLVTVYRRSTKHNGRGCPIHLFVDHPFFHYWNRFLNLNFQADFQAEINENHWESKDQGENIIPTNNLTKKSINNKERKEVLGVAFTPGNVPEEFIDAAAPFYDTAAEIYKLWGKVQLAHKLSKLEMPVEELTETAVLALRQTIFAHKHGQIKKEIIGYFFGTLRGMFSLRKRRELFNNGRLPATFYAFRDYMES